MNNPIGKTNLFATPESMEEFQCYLESLSGSERAIATTCAMMAWNLASDTVQRAIDEEHEETE